MNGREVGPPAAGPEQASPDLERVGFLTRLSDATEFALGFGCIRVGRQRRADVCISEKTVSRHHADVCYESGRYVLYDHSSNGTWVNGTLVVVAQPLRDGDTVRFGEAEYTFALKAVPRHEAVSASAQDVPTGVGKRSTLVMKGGKARRKGGRRKALVWLALALSLLVAAAAAIYFLFPGALERVIP